MFQSVLVLAMVAGCQLWQRFGGDLTLTALGLTTLAYKCVADLCQAIRLIESNDLLVGLDARRPLGGRG